MNRRTMSGRASIGVLALAGTIAALSLGCAARGPRPAPGPTTAAEVVARHVRAIGGAEAVLAGQARTVRGRLEIPSAGLEGAFTVVADRAGNAVTTIELPGLGTIRQGSDGEVAWMLNPMTGPMILDGDTAARALDGAEWDAALFDPADYDVQELLGTVEFRGTPAYRVRMVSRRGAESVHHFSVDDGWLFATEASVETPMGTIPSTTLLSDYREWGGVRFAARTVQELGVAGTQILVVEEVDLADVPEDAFEMPEAIRALLGP